MYLQHYQLNLKPFQISSDPKFLWLGENHKEALAILRYGVLDNKGFLLLTGDVGTGKTTLINALVNGLGDDVIVATIPDPGLEKIDFFNYMAAAFEMNRSFNSKGEFIFGFRSFLNDAYQEGKRVLLIIDESQRLNHELLEEIRLLSNIEKQNIKLLNIFFVGQNEFNDLLWEPRNRALRQRITINYNVYALDEKDVKSYIKHRLHVAGTDKTLFSPGAIQEIIKFSAGFPRLINIICDHALLTGYVKGAALIGAGIIRECAADLQIPHYRKTEKDTPATHETVESDSPMEIAASETATDATVSAEQDFEAEEKAIRLDKAAPDQTQKLLLIVAVLIAVFASIYIAISAMDKFWGGPVEMWHAVKQHVFMVTRRNQLPAHPDGARPIAEDTVPGDNNPHASENVVSVSGDEDSGPPAASITPDRNQDTADTENGFKIPHDAGELKVSDDTMARGGDSEIPIDRSRFMVADTGMSAREIKQGFRRAIIHFPYNSNEFSDESVAVLNHIAGILKKNPTLRVNAVGYTDSTGEYSYNKSLSQFRANIVKSYLIGKGVLPEQVTAIGKGPEDPLKPNATANGRKRNRRVEIELAEERS